MAASRRRLIRVSVIPCVGSGCIRGWGRVSLGHIHLKDIVGTAHASTSIAASTAASRSDDQPPDATPTDRASHDHEDEYCAVYAINNLLGSAQVTQPPPLPLPCVFRFVGLSAGYEADLAELHHGLSRARAPPIV
jgi:hypothetical protein